MNCVVRPATPPGSATGSGAHKACCWRKGRWERGEDIELSDLPALPCSWSHTLCGSVGTAGHILYVVVWEQPGHILYAVVWA